MVAEHGSVKCRIDTRDQEVELPGDDERRMSPGLWKDVGEVGFCHLGEARACYDTMAKVVKRLAEIRDNAEFDSINVEKYVKGVDQHHDRHDQCHGEDV